MILKKPLIAIFAGFILCLLTVMIPSCTHDPVGIETLDPICFDTQVMPILETSCLKCHDGSTEGFSMSSHADVMNYVAAGNPRKSRLYQVITNVNGLNMMPPAPDPPVSQENRIIIEVWIAQGAPNKICTQDTRVAGGR